ncbi:MAG: gliding motility-associated C-terminal domain-containing protein [Candidatus Latescibacterota bacterium]|nr:gliding motility-associated C-terminal domain-containing protein [Candidatus Latescibacterota bacterium]
MHIIHALIIPVCVCVFALSAAYAERLVFQGAESWRDWEVPFGLTEVGDQGQLRLVKYRKDIDAVRDAHLFSYESKSKGLVSGGIWEATSNPATAETIIDGDETTYWQPDPADEVEDWAIEIDLARTVLAREIRLHFPDREGARPFRQFTVYASTGARVSVKEDVVMLEPVFRTTRPNADPEIVIPLSYASRDSALILDEGIEVDPALKNGYRVVQRIRIEVEEKSPDAALAEVSVRAIGDNISLGAQQRGSFVNGINSVDPQNLFDGDMNTNNLIGSSYGSLGWKEGGVWFGVDLGATFFVDEFFLYSFKSDEGLVGYSINGTGPGHTVLYSDGAQVLQSGLPVLGAFDYTELFTHINPNADRLLYIRYIFKPRKMRYFFWHGIRDTGWGIVKWGEFMLFSPGHPAEVVLRSPFIDLGTEAGDGRPKVIKGLHWDTDLPLGAKLQLRSRSGNTLDPLYTFYDRKGDEVTEDRWKSAPKVLRGAIDTTLVVGDDWGAWSNVYQNSGEVFQSESPRRYVQLEMILGTDDPQVGPQVNSLSIEYEQALVQDARGQIWPREAPVNERTRFAYTVWPRSAGGDSGFDQVRLVVPKASDVDYTGVEVDGVAIQPESVVSAGDSLWVDLGQAVSGDSVRIVFETQLLNNATVVSADLGLSNRPGLWQSVEPLIRRSNVVMLPDLIGQEKLIGEVKLATAVITPNGDGIHDELDVRFIVYKASRVEPVLQIYDLAGRCIAARTGTEEAGQWRLHWDGRSDDSGQTAAPGSYIYEISLGTDAGDDKRTGTIAVAY